MTIRKAAGLLALVVLFSLVPLGAYSRPLGTLTQVSARVSYPDGTVVPTSWWRVGVILARSESPCEILVYREPELWILDAGGRTGRHLVDPGPSFGFHLPVAGLAGKVDPRSGLAGFEVGMEREFMADHGVKSSGGHFLFRDPDTGLEADLEVDPGTGLPRRTTLRSASGVLVTLDYEAYRTGLPVDLRRFDPPREAAVTELE